MTEAGKEMLRWADVAMYEAEPMQAEEDEFGNIVPKVTLITMTADPLGVLAAFCAMYKGKVVRHLREVSYEERLEALEDIQKTHLQAGLESIKLHFLLEGVTRSFTHQLVRQRTAVYAQESLRFAVKNDLVECTALPPSLARMDPDSDEVAQWWDCIRHIERTYHYLIGQGVPAEDARGLLPHAVTTRAHYITDLRNLVGHAGNRLCTQAQFEWRAVFLGIINAISNYGNVQEDYAVAGEKSWREDAWQFRKIAGSAMFRPVCYQLGHCPFEASFDRYCKIRERVQLNARFGRPSDRWHLDHEMHSAKSFKEDPNEIFTGDVFISGINTAEWLMDSTAARETSGGGGHD